MSPAEPLTELRAATIRADYRPGDYSVRRDADGVERYSGRCVYCEEPVGETDPWAFVTPAGGPPLPDSGIAHRSCVRPASA